MTVSMISNQGMTLTSNLKLSKLKKLNIDRNDAKQYWGSISYFLNIVLILGVYLLLTGYIAYATSTGSSSSAFYDYLISGTFDQTQGDMSYQNSIFLRIASSVLKWVLPFMSVFALTIMVISMASTIIYLSKQDTFDEVHDLHILKRQAKSQGGKSVQDIVRVYREIGGGLNYVKSTFVPDFKALAFQDAFTIGEDGRPSMKTFFQNSMPKYIVIITMIMLINDRTLLDLYTRGAEVGAFFFKKAAYDYNYVEMIQGWMETGKDFNPQYKTSSLDEANKLKTYRAMYNALKELDKSNSARTAEYKTTMGMAVRNYIETKMTGVDWTADIFKPTAQFELAVPQGMTNGGDVFAVPVNEFGVSAKQGFLVTYIRTETRVTAEATKTNYPTAWNGSPATSFDVSKAITVPTGKSIENAVGIVYANTTTGPVRLTVTASGSTVSWSLPSGVDAKTLRSITGEVTYRFSGSSSSRAPLYISWVNPAYTAPEPTNQNTQKNP